MIQIMMKVVKYVNICSAFYNLFILYVFKILYEIEKDVQTTY